MKSEYRHLMQLRLYRTGEYPCNYLPARTACSQMVAPLDAVKDTSFGALLDLGFRRSGLYIYRPQCHDCQACTPIRVLVEDFTPNRSQRRCHQRWAHLIAHIVPLEFSPEHYALYRRYVATRHADGSMASDGEAQYRQFFLTSPITTLMVEFRQADGRLLMVSVVDQTANGLSAMYTFFDPAPEFSGLGTYGILWQIQIAREFALQYVYLGYWIAESPKMAYKRQFAPAEILTNGTWMPLTDNPEP